MKRLLKVLLAIVAAVLLVAPVAVAKHTVPAGNAVLADCDQHGALTQHYTHAQLSHALKAMPTWMKQYTSCQSVVQTALANGTVSANGTGKGGGSSISTVLIIVIVVVVVAIVAFAGLLIRRRRRLATDDASTQVIEPDRHDDDGGDDGRPAP